MPLPSPRKGQSKDKFLKSCMANKQANKDFPDNKQRFAVCNDMWRKKKKEGKSMGNNQENNHENNENNEERRVLNIEASEIRVHEGEDGNTLSGHAAVFNKFSDDLGGFREKIAPGAFKSAIKDSDTRALFNHNPNFVIGRSSAGTLELKEDEKGLFFRTSLPNTTWANDLRVSCQRGDINQCSFGFTIETQEWKDKEDGSVERTIVKVRDLLDVSVVTFPAYPQTDAAVRQLKEHRKAAEEESNDCPHCAARNQEPETDESNDPSKDWSNSPERVDILRKELNFKARQI